MHKVYNKLVRDKFIDIYEDDVKRGISMLSYKAHTVSNEERNHLLISKLQEEVSEVANSYDDTSKLTEELADVVEVLRGIVHAKIPGISFADIIAIADTKKEKKGGFENGVYLESIDYIDK